MDDVDRRIVSILQENGRVSLLRIGEKVGLSHVAVRKRIRNLCKDLVKISAGLKIGALGFRVAIVNVEVESPERLGELIDVFSRCPRIVFLLLTTGAYNLMSVMVAEDADTLNSIAGTCSIRAQKGIRRSEVIIGEAPIIPGYMPINITPAREGEDAPCGINCSRCNRYQTGKCLGCPGTEHYRGPL